MFASSPFAPSSPFRSSSTLFSKHYLSIRQSETRLLGMAGGWGDTEMRIVSKSGRLLTGHVHRKPREQFLRSFVSELLSLLSYSRLALPVWNLIRFLQVYLSLVVLTNFSYSNFLWLIFFFFLTELPISNLILLFSFYLV